MDLNPASWVRQTSQFVTDVRSEYRKVTWPAQKEYVGGTIGVVVIVFVVTLVLGIVDFGLGRLLSLVVP